MLTKKRRYLTKIFLQRHINKDLFFIIAVVTLLVATWFRHGNLMGGGESGLVFYDLKAMYEKTRFAWRDSILGSPSLTILGDRSYYWFMSRFQLLGVPGFVIQAGYFWFLLIVSSFSIYFLYLELFRKDARGALLASLFYIFNPISLVIVWNRFLYIFMGFYAFLPLAYYIFIRGIKRKNLSHAFLLVFVSIPFSFSIIAPAQLILLWVVIFLTSFFYLLTTKTRRFIVGYTLLTFILWAFANVWWLSQLYGLILLSTPQIANASERFFSGSGNLSGLLSLSREQGHLTSLINLKSYGFFKLEGFPFDWPHYYDTALAKLFTWASTFLILLTIITKRKSKSILLLASLFFLILFLTKGVQPPFGEIFKSAFIYFSPFQVFRNPLEKFGIVFPLATSLLFGYGATTFVEKVKNRVTRKHLYLLALSYPLVFWGAPFWSSLVLTGRDVPSNDLSVGYQVKPPNYYDNAKSWIQERINNNRIIAFPIGGEGIYYDWEKGYRGIEQTNTLLGVSSISYNTTIPFYNKLAKEIEGILKRFNDFYKAAGLFSSSYVISREDIDYKRGGMRNPDNIKELLEEEESLNFVKNFDGINFYEIKDDLLLPKIYPSRNLIFSSSPRIEDIFLGKGELGDAIVSTDAYTNNVDSVYSLSERATVFHPKGVYFYPSSQKFSYVKDSEYFPGYNISPDSIIYPAILVKEKLEVFLTPELDARTVQRLFFQGKRIVEFKEEYGLGKTESAIKALEQFRKELDVIAKEIKLLYAPSGGLLEPEDAKRMREYFGRHLAALEDSQERADDKTTADFLEEAVVELQSITLGLGILPANELQEEEGFPIEKRQVFRFDINIPGDYEMFIPDLHWNEHFVNIPQYIKVQIDDSISRPEIYPGEEGISLSSQYFEEGSHEISFNVFQSENLVDSPEGFSLETDNDLEEVVFSVSNFEPFYDYETSFKYSIKLGERLRFDIRQDIDPVIEGNIIAQYSKNLGIDRYWHDERPFGVEFEPDSSADSLQLAFVVKPWNNCEEIFRRITPKACLDEKFAEKYNKMTRVAIKDLEFTRRMTAPLVLLKKGTKYDKLAEKPLLNFNKINPTKYEIGIKNAEEEPFLLVFSELYNPGWALYLSMDNGVKERVADEKHILVNGFANGWLVEGVEESRAVLEFSPQRALVVSSWISVAAISAISSYLFLVGIRNKKGPS